ncbi:hypothetical protein [Citricoccus sp. NR2]|uniref:hypothetical protein n=1 Tax=Citricoccus sp. NR2 TaxID=3004095 RepID=UPI0022DE79D7|nr:hypothetical protein [Citricoccus sp. NR2]WBL19987.1 hypothetical protein O1A05_04680 [Citricoccus sp. NR2]
MQSPKASAFVCSIIAATALIAVALSFGVVLLFPNTPTPWLFMIVASCVAAVTGIYAGLETTFPRPVPALTSAAYAVVGLILVITFISNYLDDLSGGANSIGGGLLILVAMLIIVPASIGAVVFVIFTRRELKQHA